MLPRVMNAGCVDPLRSVLLITQASKYTCTSDIANPREKARLVTMKGYFIEER